MILQKVKVKAHKLDKQFSIFGFTFGWGFIISERSFSVISSLVFMAFGVVALVPILGDILNLVLNYWLVVAQAQKAEYVTPISTHLTTRVLKIPCGAQASRLACNGDAHQSGDLLWLWNVSHPRGLDCCDLWVQL